MALLLTDSWDHYTNPVRKWNGLSGGTFDASGVLAGAGRRSTAGFRIRQSGGSSTEFSHALRRNLIASGNTFISGFGFNSVTNFTGNYEQSNAPEGNSSKILCVRKNNFNHVHLDLQTNGTIIVRRRTDYQSAVIIGQTNTALIQGQYTFIEFKVVIDNTVGAITIRFDGNVVMNVTGIDTQSADGGSAAWDELWLGPMCVANAGSPFDWVYDDLYVLDGSGPAPWNNFLGDCRVDVRLPQAVGASATWTPLTGTNNVAMVGEALEDGDTTYVSALTPGQIDTYVMQDVAVPGATIYGVQLCPLTRKSDAGLCKMSSIVRHGGLDYPTVMPDPGLSYSYKTLPMAVNPAHGGVWTETEFNQAEFGFVRTEEEL